MFRNLRRRGVAVKLARSAARDHAKAKMMNEDLLLCLDDGAHERKAAQRCEPVERMLKALRSIIGASDHVYKTPVELGSSFDFTLIIEQCVSDARDKPGAIYVEAKGCAFNFGQVVASMR